MIEETLKEWLDETELSESAKRILINDSKKLYEKIGSCGKTGYVPLRLQRAKVALFLACDNRMCAVPRVIPKPRVKYLSPVRRALKIPHVHAIDRVDSICTILDIEKRDDIAKKAKELISRNNAFSCFSSLSPTVTAVNAVYVSSILNGSGIKYKIIKDVTGVALMPSSFFSVLTKNEKDTVFRYKKDLRKSVLRKRNRDN